MHLVFDVVLCGACLGLLGGWLTAEGKIRMLCADIAIRAHRYARRESEFKARETTRVIQIEFYQAKIHDLEAQAGDRHAGLRE